MAENIIGPRKLGGGPSRDPNNKSGGSNKKGDSKKLNDSLKSVANQNKDKDKSKNKKPESGSVADQNKDKGDSNDKSKKSESGSVADQSDPLKSAKDQSDPLKSAKDKNDKKSSGNNDQDSGDNNDDDQDDDRDDDQNDGDESIANKIIRRKPDDDDRKRQRRRKELAQLAKTAPKAAAEYSKLKALSDFYEHFLYPIIKFLKAAWTWIKNALAWIGEKMAGFWRMLSNFFQNLPRYLAMAGRKIGQLFGAAKSKLVSGITNAFQGLGLVANAALVSTISNAVIGAGLLAFFSSIISIIGMIFIFFNPVNQLKKTLNNASCEVKASQSDSSEADERYDAATSGGSSAGKITVTQVRKKVGKIKIDKDNWHKSAVILSKATHKMVPKLKTEYIYAQMYQETGGVMTNPAREDKNFTGISGNARMPWYDTYGGGTSRGVGGSEGGTYQRFRSYEGFVAEYATTLKNVVTGYGHKIDTVKKYNDALWKAHYYQHAPSPGISDPYTAYLNGLKTGVQRYKSGGGNIIDKITDKTKAGYESAKDAIQNIWNSWIGGSSSQNCRQVTDDNSVDSGSILKEAKKFKGWFKYGRAGNSSNWKNPTKSQIEDCSGFVWLVIKRVTKNKAPIWYTKSAEGDAESSHKIIKKINRSQARPGDIVIVNTGSGVGENGHMAILESKWNGENDKTRVIQMGGYGESQGVNEHGFRESFLSLLNRSDTKITLARVLGIKSSSSSSDTISSNVGKGQAVIRKLSKADNDARRWIIFRESSGISTAQNGRYYGYYQLDRSYFKKGTYHSDGTLSKSNQHVVGYYYMKSRYHTWTKAKAFWKAHGWW